MLKVQWGEQWRPEQSSSCAMHYTVLQCTVHSAAMWWWLRWGVDDDDEDLRIMMMIWNCDKTLITYRLLCAKIHSFPTMYIIGGGKFGVTRWKKCLKPKRSPKNSCFGGNESQLHNFGRVWDPNFLRWPQFGGYPRKATCLSFKMSYVQGP